MGTRADGYPTDVSDVLDDLLRRRVLWVTGKGGVGKSTLSAALALLAARRGKRTLLIDAENKGDSARFLDAGPPRYEAKEAQKDLLYLGIQPEEILDEYLRVAMRVPRIRRIGPIQRVFDFIATAAPGIREVLIAGKVGFEERERADGGPRWDLLVVDAAPAGQVLSHLRGPRTVQEMVGVGMIRNQTAWVRDILEDPERTGIVCVALPEEMPVAETAELLEDAPKAVDTPVLALVANRVVPPPRHPDVLEAFRGRTDALTEVLGAAPDPALDAMGLLAELAASQAPHLERLRGLGPPTLEVPFLPLGRHDLRMTQLVVDALTSLAVELAEAGS